MLNKAKITVLGFLHFQVMEHGQQPKTIRFDLDRDLKLDVGQLPYIRPSMKVTEQWSEIEYGYVDNPGLILFSALAPSFDSIPTPEEREATLNVIIELAVVVNGTPIPYAKIRPGDPSGPFEPLNETIRYVVRCRQGTAKLTYVVIPDTAL